VKVGDLVKRKKTNGWKVICGIVVSLQMGGSNPVHECASVLYPETGQQYDIAVSLLEVIS
jgi:hypothetical protein